MTVRLPAGCFNALYLGAERVDSPQRRPREGSKAWAHVSSCLNLCSLWIHGFPLERVKKLNGPRRHRFQTVIPAKERVNKSENLRNRAAARLSPQARPGELAT
jgi:hypothetical protein